MIRYPFVTVPVFRLLTPAVLRCAGGSVEQAQRYGRSTPLPSPERPSSVTPMGSPGISRYGYTVTLRCQAAK